MNNLLVYIHTRPVDGAVFYVGIGCGDRPYRVKGRNDRWQKTFRKHGRDVTIVAENLSWDDACAMEKELIAFHRVVSEPTLTNMSDGGDGAKGWMDNATEEERESFRAKCREKNARPDIKKILSETSKRTTQTDKWKAANTVALEKRWSDPEQIEAARLKMIETTLTPEWKAAMVEGCKKRGESWRKNIASAQRTPEVRKLKARTNKVSMQCQIVYADRAKRLYTSLVAV